MISKDQRIIEYPKNNANMAIEGANLPILGRVKTPLEITFFSPNDNEKRFFKWKVAPLVVPGLLNNFLMSKKALTEIDNSIRLNKATFRLHFEDQPDLIIPICVRNMKAKLKNNLTIKPHHIRTIALHVPEAKVGETLVIEPDPGIAEERGILSINVLDTVRPGKLVHMEVWNATDHIVDIRKNMEWGVSNPYKDQPDDSCVFALAKNVEKMRKIINKIQKSRETLVPRTGSSDTNEELTSPKGSDDMKRESGTGAEQLIKENWPKDHNEMIKRLWRELDFDNPDCELTREQKMMFVDIFARVPQAMALGPYDVGLVKGLELSIDTKDHPPIAHKCRPISPKKKEALKAQIKRWLGQGVAEWGNGPWASATVIVAKAGGGYRVCADYPALNKITVRDAGPVAHMGEKLARIKAAQGEEPKYFASLDLSDAYYCVPVRKEDVDKTAMITPMGLLKFNRMSFGLKNAPAMWNQVTQIIEKKYLEKLPLVGRSLLMYFDDAVLSAATVEELAEKLEAFLEVIADVGCRVQPRKCKIGQRLKWCGHIFDKNGIYPNPDYIQTMKEWDTPTTTECLAQRCGKLEWVAKFVQNMKQKTHAIWDMKARYPPYKKNEKKVPIDWYEDPRCQEQWDAIMEELTSAPVLAHPDWSEEREPFIVEVDTSSKGIGAILYQPQWVENPDTGTKEKQERVISFASKRLQGGQSGYSAYKLELLGLLTAIQHWQYFLIDKKFKVRSDHRALKWLTTTTNKNLPHPLHRWQEALNADYEFDIEWVPGTQLKGVDALSRKKYKDGDNGNMEDIRLRDPVWAECDVDPEQAASRTDDDFWMPIMKTKRRRKEEDEASDYDSGYDSGEDTPTIMGAITRSKKQALSPGVETDTNNEETGEEENEFFEEGEGPPQAKFDNDDEGWDDLIQGFTREDKAIQDYLEEDAEVIIRPKTAWWWHEHVRRAQNLDPGLKYLKGHLEKQLPLPTTNKEVNSMVKKAFEGESATDEEKNALSKILVEIKNGGKVEVTREHSDDPGILTIIRKGRRKKLIIIPAAKRTEHLQMVHHGHGTLHRGAAQTITAMEEYFWFPEMRPFTQEYINTCKQCQDGKKMGPRQSTTLGRTSSHENARLKNWAIDIVEMPKGKYGFKYILTALDVSSRWMEAWPLTKATAAQVTRIIEEDMIPRYGEDLTIMSDQAKIFLSKLMRRVTDKRGCRRYFSTPYHANSLPVERYHRTLNSLIRILLLDKDLPKESWPEVLHLALYTMRCTPDTGSKTSAFERLFGRPPATQIASWTGTQPEEKEIPEDFPIRDVINDTPGMYPNPQEDEGEEEPNSKLNKIPGKNQDFYSAVNALGWRQEYAQTKKDQAALKTHNKNADRMDKRKPIFVPVINQLVDWKIPYDVESPDSKKFAKQWAGVYAVTENHHYKQTVRIQKVEKNINGEYELVPGTSRVVWVGDIRPTLNLADEVRPHGDWNPPWIQDR